jgi:hypothetical protein
MRKISLEDFVASGRASGRGEEYRQFVRDFSTEEWIVFKRNELPKRLQKYETLGNLAGGLVRAVERVHGYKFSLRTRVIGDEVAFLLVDREKARGPK